VTSKSSPRPARLGPSGTGLTGVHGGGAAARPPLRRRRCSSSQSKRCTTCGGVATAARQGPDPSMTDIHMEAASTSDFLPCESGDDRWWLLALTAEAATDARVMFCRNWILVREEGGRDRGARSGGYCERPRSPKVASGRRRLAREIASLHSTETFGISVRRIFFIFYRWKTV
jgi:hypothetical protein